MVHAFITDSSDRIFGIRRTGPGRLTISTRQVDESENTQQERRKKFHEIQCSWVQGTRRLSSRIVLDNVNPPSVTGLRGPITRTLIVPRGNDFLEGLVHLRIEILLV